MGSALSLRSDFDGARLRLLARQTRDADQARRLLALASIYDGGSRADAARLGSVTVQIVRDWVVRFNERGPDGLINGKAPGKPSLLNDEQRTALAQAIERGPTPYLDGVVRWRLRDLAQWIWEDFRISVSEETLGREVRAMGYRKLSARPRHHAQDAEAAEAFKKTYGSPRLQALYDRCLNSLRQRIRSQGKPWPRWSSAHSDPHNFLGGLRHFFNQDFEMPIDSQAIFHNHMQISSAASAGGDRC
jgi:transposase